MEYVCSCGKFKGAIEFVDGEESRAVPCPGCYFEKTMLPSTEYVDDTGKNVSRKDLEQELKTSETDAIKVEVGRRRLKSRSGTVARYGVVNDVQKDGTSVEWRAYDGEESRQLRRRKRDDEQQ